MLFLFDDGKEHFNYRIIRKNRLKNIYIRIVNDTAIISANKRVKEKYLHDFLLSKSNWVIKHIKKVDQKPKLDDADAYIYLLGKKRKVTINIASEIKENILEVLDKKAIFHISSKPNHDMLIKLRNEYYKRIIPAYTEPIIEKYSSIMNLNPNKISYRSMKSRWGSCSSVDNISLNTALMMLPCEIMSYVILHELSHIVHKNHSSNFWEYLGKYMPEYKQNKIELRKYEIFL